jgi:hypothetical protein
MGVCIGVYITVASWIVGTAWNPALAAETQSCRQTIQHQVCILSIQRSAKNYWEYRAAVSIDGLPRPVEIYNCRDRIRILKDGGSIPFQPGDAGEVVCRLFKRNG